MSRVSAFTTTVPSSITGWEEVNNIVVDDIQDNIKTRQIFIYNVANLSHPFVNGGVFSRFPNFPRINFIACPLDKEYVQVGNLTDPHPEFVYGTDEQTYIKYVDGIREACRLMCPQSPGGRSVVKNDKDVIKIQDFVLNNDNYSLDNLNELGIFWSFNNPPTQEEVDAAIKRLEKTYANELQRMTRVELENPKDASYAANYISRRAADYFDKSFSWHNTSFSKAAKVAVEATKTPMSFKDCPDCGWNDIPEKAKKCFHCEYRFEETKTELTPLEKARAAKAAKKEAATA